MSCYQCARKFVQASVLLLLLSQCSSTLQDAPKKPHILFMLVDDWGWANVGYHRDTPTKEVVTPNFDNLVKEGLELDQHYVFKLCSPSRCSLLTGRLPIHVNDNNKINPSCHNPNDPISGFQGIPRNMTVIAEKLKGAGYATHQVGKWDAGMATPDHIPKGRGFDSSLCYFHHDNDFYNETVGKCNKDVQIVDLWGTDKPATGLNGTGPNNYEEGLFKEQLLNIINEHDPTTPLFLYYATHAPHDPYEVPDSYWTQYSFIDNYYRRIYHAMVAYVDDVVGEVVEALKSKGLWDDLLFVVSSDNGGPISLGKGANNYPLRGGKASDWQGGVRVNAFASGGYLPEKMRGQKTEGYIHIADWYSTFCALAGVDPTDERAAKAKLPPIDSLNMWPLISGQNSTSPRTDITLTKDSLIVNDYKILTGDVNNAVWTGPHYPNSSQHVDAVMHCGNTGCLYNIKKDPEEHTDLAAKMPDLLSEMRKKLTEYQNSRFQPDRGDEWPGACDTALNKYGGFWGPFLE